MQTRILMTAAAIALTATSAYADFNDAPPNAKGQQPAFEGQTRAPVVADTTKLTQQVIVDGLDHPWAVAPLPDGGWLVTERAGQLRMVSADGKLSDPITGGPKTDARGQGGLLDVLVDPDFAQTRQIWLSYASAGEGGNATEVARAKLSQDGTALEDLTTVFRQKPDWQSDKHFGSRLVLDGKGGLFITLGERSNPDSRAIAQNDDNTFGKLVRVNPETGEAAEGNPNVDGWLPEVYAKGFRNVQAAALDGNGQLWTIEHGPKGGDELNRPEAGKNYGWPIITYGLDYSGAEIGKGLTAQEGLEQPVYYWDPVIGPSGMLFYEGAMLPEWDGSIIVGGLVSKGLVRLTLDDGKVSGEARYPLDARVRDVAEQPDGSLVVVTDESNGALIHLTK